MDCEISVPRNRNGEFKPKVIVKGSFVPMRLTDNCGDLLKKMPQEGIEDMLHNIYGSEISLELFRLGAFL